MTKKMKMVLYWLFFLSFVTMKGQTTKTFECESFSFEYPTSYKVSPIIKTPSMVLKLVSGTNYIFFSYKNNNSNVDSIWDVPLSNFSSKSEEMEFISVTKELVNTKGGQLRCIKFVGNQRMPNGMYAKLVNYAFIHNGKLLFVGFCSDGKFTKSSSTLYQDKLLAGLRLKNVDTLKSVFEKKFKETATILNNQCPVRVDECTTHLMVLLLDKTFTFKTMIYSDCASSVNYNEFKERMCMNFRRGLDKGFVQCLDKYGYSISYMIYDENDRFLKKIKITGQDILNYY